MLNGPCVLNPLKHSGYCVPHIHNIVAYFAQSKNCGTKKTVVARERF
jgi:hypothetical protein